MTKQPHRPWPQPASRFDWARAIAFSIIVSVVLHGCA